MYNTDAEDLSATHKIMKLDGKRPWQGKSRRIDANYSSELTLVTSDNANNLGSIEV